MVGTHSIHSFLPVLESWFGGEMARIYAGDPHPCHDLLLVCPVWGEKYVHRFAHYCLPTLMAPENHKAMAGRTRLQIYTDAESFSDVWAYTRGLEARGIQVRIWLISPEVMRMLPESDLNKYWVLGIIGNVAVQLAWRDQMGVHILHPDVLYGPTYFKNLLRLAETHDGIAVTGLTASIETAAPEVEHYRVTEEGDYKGALIIPDRDLGDIGWRHLHPQTQGSLMNRASVPDDMPHSHFLAWQARDKIVLHSCHMNAAWMKFDHDKPPKTRIPATIDAELPSFMKPDFYVPTIEDGLTFIELSDDTKPAELDRVGMPAFIHRAWTSVRFQRDWMPWFVRPCEVPIHPGSLPSWAPPTLTYMEPEDIQLQFAQIMHHLEAGKFDAMEKFIGSLVEAPR